MDGEPICLTTALRHAVLALNSSARADDERLVLQVLEDRKDREKEREDLKQVREDDLKVRTREGVQK
eukprot:3825560-Rhodomonas_salina.1